MSELNANMEALRTELSDLIQTDALSQSKVSKEIGVSGATLSGFLKGTYPGNNEEVEKKLTQWLSNRKREKKLCLNVVDQPGWVETVTASKILNALNYAHMAGDISVIYGGSGVGKTESLKHYAEDHPNVWIATMTPAHAGVAPSLEEVAFSLDMRDSPGRSARLMREIIRRVRDTRGLLIVDEAQHLTSAALESIRSIHDATGIGLILSGNESVFSRLSGGKRSAVFAQLYSRVGKRLRINKSLKSDVVAVANAHKIDGKKEQKTLWEIGKKPGGLRVVIKTIRLASVVALGKSAKVDDTTIRAAWMDLSGESID